MKIIKSKQSKSQADLEPKNKIYGGEDKENQDRGNKKVMKRKKHMEKMEEPYRFEKKIEYEVDILGSETKYDEVAANLAYGKLRKNGSRTSIKAQIGLSCLLFSARRFYDGRYRDLGDSNEYQAYKILKNGFIDSGNSKTDNMYANLAEVALKACDELNINLLELLNLSYVYHSLYPFFIKDDKQLKKEYKSGENSDIYKYYQDSPEKIEKYNKIIFTSLYTELRDHIFKKFGLVAGSEWNPSQNIYQLMDTIRYYGALIMVGTLSMAYFKGVPVKWNNVYLGPTVEYKDMRPKDFYVLSEEKYIDQNYDELHAVIVDAVKKTRDRKYMVFFRDPGDSSGGEEPEQVYAMEYENFCKHVHPILPSKCMDGDEFYTFRSRNVFDK